jgi:hypothetical protein
MRHDRPSDSNLGQPSRAAGLFNAIEGNSMSEQDSTNPSSTNLTAPNPSSDDPKPNHQARVLELLIQYLDKSLKERNLKELEATFEQGVHLTRLILDGKDGPLHPEWTTDRPVKVRKSAGVITVLKSDPARQ